jgi:hypothetical protein
MQNFRLRIRYLFENDAFDSDFFGASAVQDQEVATQEPAVPQKPRNFTPANPIRRLWLKNTKSAIANKVQKELASLPKLQRELRASAAGATSPLFNDKPIAIPGKDIVYNVRRVIMAYAYDMLRMYLNDQKGTQKYDVLGINPDDTYQILPLANEIATYVADNLLAKDAFADYVIKYYEDLL